MKTTILDLLTSKKFLAALSAIILYLAGRFGFQLDPAALDRIFAALLVYVGAQGVADVGKSAALIHADAPSNDNTQVTVTNVANTPSGGGLATAAMLVAVLFGGLVTAPGCASWDTVKADTSAVAHGAVACAKADVPAIKALGLQLTTEALVSALGGHGVPWAQLELEAEAGAKAQGVAVGSCAFGQLIADLAKLLPAPSTPTVMARADDGRGDLATLKAHLGVASVDLGDGRVM